MPASATDQLTEGLRTDKLEVPPLPDVAMQVMQLARDPKANAQGLADWIHKDPAIASYTLRVANSPAYGATVEIVSLPQAIARLGMAEVSNMVVTQYLLKSVTIPAFKDELRDLWRRSLITGVFCRETSRALKLNVETGFLCGLLHNVGLPVALKITSEANDTRVHKLPKETVWDAAVKLAPNVGAALGLAWKLPQVVRATIAYHEDWSRAPSAYASAVCTTALARDFAQAAILDADSNGHPERAHANAVQLQAAEKHVTEKQTTEEQGTEEQDTEEPQLVDLSTTEDRALDSELFGSADTEEIHDTQDPRHATDPAELKFGAPAFYTHPAADELNLYTDAIDAIWDAREKALAAASVYQS